MKRWPGVSSESSEEGQEESQGELSKMQCLGCVVARMRQVFLAGVKRGGLKRRRGGDGLCRYMKSIKNGKYLTCKVLIAYSIS